MLLPWSSYQIILHLPQYSHHCALKWTMKISWAVVLLFAGLVLAQHHRYKNRTGCHCPLSKLHLLLRHSPIEYAVSDEGHLGHLDYDTTGTELRQVVTSLKDLKSCLCKLITVQKKQIELELLRAQGSTVGAPNQEGKEIEKGLVGTPLFATEKPTPTNDLTVNQPQGASVDIKLTPTTVDPQSAKDSQTTETPRDKRQSSSHGSDFTEIAHDDFQKLIDRGFNFDEDSEAEKEFLAENPSSDVGAVSITTIPKNADRKTRKVKEESGPKEIEEAEEEVAEAIKPKKAMSEESSMETPTAPEHLTVSYDRMEKKKAMPTVSLKSLIHILVNMKSPFPRFLFLERTPWNSPMERPTTTPGTNKSPSTTP